MPLPPLPSPPLSALRLFGFVKGCFASAFLFTTLLGFNLLQAASALLLPVSRRLVRRINRRAANLFWGLCAALGRMLHGANIVVTGTQVPAEEEAIVIANHQQMTDVTFLMFFAQSKRRLGDLKWMLKRSVLYVPGVGWGLYFLDSFFVRRNWTEDRASITATFSRIVRDGIPVWFVSFVEGTRLTLKKLAKSQAYAREKGLVPLKHLLIPRSKGFVASVEGLKGHITAVYDLTFGYEKGVPSLWQYIQGFSRRAHIHGRRYPSDALPAEPQALA
ncbi:MAG: lysophospholipid acyltransferase family protein, partial [Myxococcota bacterium]|nr:lysophospholipid acyltransferase family protein [Myxococcota bacterium]